MDVDQMMDEEVEYPGLEFNPPEGTIGPDEVEGDALVTWKKVGDRYTITLFEGKKVVPGASEPKEDETKESSMEELDSMAML